MQNNNSNKLTVALGIFSVLLLICLGVLLWDNASIKEQYRHQTSQYIQTQQSQYKQEIFKKIKEHETFHESPSSKEHSSAQTSKEKYQKEIIKPENQLTNEYQQDALTNEINYIFNDSHEYVKYTTDFEIEESINNLIEEIEESENRKTSLDEDFIKISLEEDKFFVYLGHFYEEDAIRLTNYLQYLNYKTILKTSRDIHFVLVEFKEKIKADEFLAWAKENSFHEATIISK